jgi:hypothetical protein
MVVELVDVQGAMLVPEFEVIIILLIIASALVGMTTSSTSRYE